MNVSPRPGLGTFISPTPLFRAWATLFRALGASSILNESDYGSTSLSGLGCVTSTMLFVTVIMPPVRLFSFPVTPTISSTTVNSRPSMYKSTEIETPPTPNAIINTERRVTGSGRVSCITSTTRLEPHPRKSVFRRTTKVIIGCAGGIRPTEGSRRNASICLICFLCK